MVLFLAGTASAEILYDVIDLGTLGGYSSSAHGVNDVGQIVGFSATEITDPSSGYKIHHAFIWEDGIMQDIGALDSYLESQAYAINNSGVIVGFSSNPSSPMDMRASIWQDGTVVDVAGPESQAYDINDTGQTVGCAAPVCQTAFVYDSVNGMQYPGGQAAYGINNKGQVVGHGWIWENGTKRSIPVGQGMEINELGQVVGHGWVSGQIHALLWDDGLGQLTDLGVLSGHAGGYATSINDAGQVVGYSDSDAFLWEDGVMYNLSDLIPPDSGWQLIRATDINNNGWIVGYGTNPEGEPHAFLLVPEPATLSLLAIGGLALMRRKRE